MCCCSPLRCHFWSALPLKRIQIHSFIHSLPPPDHRVGAKLCCITKPIFCCLHTRPVAVSGAFSASPAVPQSESLDRLLIVSRPVHSGHHVERKVLHGPPGEDDEPWPERRGPPEDEHLLARGGAPALGARVLARSQCGPQETLLLTGELLAHLQHQLRFPEQLR